MWTVLGEGAEAAKNRPLGAEDGKPLATTRQTFTAKKFLWLLLQPLHHPDLDYFIQPEASALQCLPQGAKHMESHGNRSRWYGRWSVQHHTAHAMLPVLASMGNTGTGVVQHEHTPRGTLSPDDGTKVSKGFTTTLCADGGFSVLERQHHGMTARWPCLDGISTWMASMQPYLTVDVCSIAPVPLHPARGRLPAYHAHSNVTTCDLAAPRMGFIESPWCIKLGAGLKYLE